MFAFESVIQQCSTNPVQQQQKIEEKTWFSIGSHYHPCSPSLLKQSIVDLVIFPSVFSFPLKPTIFHWVTLHNGKSCSPSPIEINDRFTGSLFHQCSPSPIGTIDLPLIPVPAGMQNGIKGGLLPETLRAVYRSWIEWNTPTRGVMNAFSAYSAESSSHTKHVHSARIDVISKIDLARQTRGSGLKSMASSWRQNTS